jgi:hypothetical protein
LELQSNLISELFWPLVSAGSSNTLYQDFQQTPEGFILVKALSMKGFIELAPVLGYSVLSLLLP